MGSTRRRWVWLAIVALVAAIWWLVPRRTSPSPTPPVPEPQAVEPQRKSTPVLEAREAPEDAEPIAAPLPRDEVELPSSSPPVDGGVADAGSIEQRRDAMLGTVLDRLNADLAAAEESGNEEEAERLRIRIERLRQRRDELAEP
jgi:hypothetical protein